MLAYNLGSKHDTFELDREVAERLPKDMPAIVYIGINIGRFCNSPSDPSLNLPDPEIPAPAYYQHVYSIHKRIQSASLKRYYVKYWLTRRWPEFKAHYSYNIRVVESVVKTCIRRGLHPVLVDLPRDLPIIGHSFDSPVYTYKAGCKRLAAKYHIPWLTFVAAAALRRPRLLRHLPPRGTGPRQVPAPALGEDRDVARQVRPQPGADADADALAVAHGDAVAHAVAHGDAGALSRRSLGGAAAAAEGPPARQIAQPKRPCFSKYFW